MLQAIRRTTRTRTACACLQYGRASCAPSPPARTTGPGATRALPAIMAWIHIADRERHQRWLSYVYTLALFTAIAIVIVSLVVAL
jgi:hypothetical protein